MRKESYNCVLPWKAREMFQAGGRGHPFQMLTGQEREKKRKFGFVKVINLENTVSVDLMSEVPFKSGVKIISHKKEETVITNNYNGGSWAKHLYFPGGLHSFHWLFFFF